MVRWRWQEQIGDSANSEMDVRRSLRGMISDVIQNCRKVGKGGKPQRSLISRAWPKRRAPVRRLRIHHGYRRPSNEHPLRIPRAKELSAQAARAGELDNGADDVILIA
jgi:hypothetical protein